MKNKFLGLDVLRGIGIFSVIFLHTAFYYFSGLYNVDFNKPPLIVTIIGLLLMFAGMFAIISGFVHTHQYNLKLEEKKATHKQLIKYEIIFGGLIFVVAYLYFVFTGPGIINFDSQSMNNSIFVELIRHNKLIFTNFERLFYVDSLVMIAFNIILLTLFSCVVKKAKPQWRSRIYFISTILFMIISIVRIPLYNNVWLPAMDNQNYLLVLLLNIFVAKNNPIFPFFAFGLLGAWLATTLKYNGFKKSVKKIIFVALTLFSLGIVLYINLEDTMLERAIDLKWYSIMIAQLGLFLLLIVGALKHYDFGKKRKNSKIAIFFSRFSKGGLTAFFLESLISAIIFRIMLLFNPNINFNVGSALFFGFVLAILWGFILKIWEKYNYKYSIEYFISKILNKTVESSKLKKLNEGNLNYD